MKYILQVVKGRSTTTTLKLNDGVTSIGRHDDCVIRIKSSQVSRRHCELLEDGEALTLRDLGSSNGTFVNGKRVLGQQQLKHGDEVTLGAVTLRVAQLGQAISGPVASPKLKAGDTAVVEAIPDEAEEEEFELEFDDETLAPEVEGIPLADDNTVVTSRPTPAKGTAKQASVAAPEPVQTAAKPADGKDDDAVAQFLLDLKLDDEE
jgi:pSer/pThr/pTyr-binding forkhead associated (FHA) protein